jgi:DNA-binding response OmpR family regulator
MKAQPKAPSGGKTRKRILIVDDDPKILELFSALLQEAGYDVEPAEHALAAVAAVVRQPPDLILADIRMPIVGGKDLVRELKSHSDSRQIPVVAVTGYDSPEARDSALKAGYDEYMTKPIDARRFPQQIAELLRRFEGQQAAPTAP